MMITDVMIWVKLVAFSVSASSGITLGILGVLLGLPIVFAVGAILLVFSMGLATGFARGAW